MSEACAAVTEYWFDDLNQPVLQVVKAVDNERSRLMSVRTDMRVIETLDHDFRMRPAAGRIVGDDPG